MNVIKNTKIFAITCLCMCAHLSFAQQSIRLNRGWEYLKGDLGGIWEAIRPVAIGTPESVPIWSKVELPHCFNALDATDPDVNYYQGPGWYRTRLKIQNPYANGRILLHFEGAGQKTQVFVYDQKVGEHVGGYDEWTVDITEAVESFSRTQGFKGEVPISIRCDNSRNLQMIPSDLSDFNLYGGIYRYLNLVYVPQLSIEKMFALAETDASGIKGNVRLSARLHNPLGVDTADVKFTLKDPWGQVVHTDQKQIKAFYGKKSLFDFEINKPALWSTENPQMYVAELSISAKGETHVRRENIGFRHFEFIKNGPFHLNGKRLLLKGTHRHEDHAGVAAAMTEDMMKQEMQMMKDMGVNFIRLGHYQQSRIILDLCDSLGILVWEEIPWCRGGLGGDVYKAQARRMLTNMIEQHYNHPSVIIWGLGNENDWPGDFTDFDKHQIREFMKELHDLSHTLDDTRKTAIRRCDFCKDIVDVYSPSIWAGWYRGVYTQYKEVSEREFGRVDHFLHVEWGGDNHARRFAEDPEKLARNIKQEKEADERAGDASLYGGNVRYSRDGDWSESYICNLIDWHLKEQETMPWLTGTAYWPFKDFSTPVRPENPVPYVNQKGVVERDLTKKEAYYVFQSYWIEEPMVRIFGHNWQTRWGNPDERKEVKVYSNCDEAELFVNGISLGTKKRNSADFPAAGLRWNVQYKEGDNTIKVIARKGKHQVTDEITQGYQSKKWGRPAKLELIKIAENENTVTVEAKLLDKEGVPCLDTQDYVRFTLAGDGKLIDNLGTSTASNKLQTYNGRAIISIQKNGGKGVVSASSDNINSVFLEI